MVLIAWLPRTRFGRNSLGRRAATRQHEASKAAASPCGPGRGGSWEPIIVLGMCKGREFATKNWKEVYDCENMKKSAARWLLADARVDMGKVCSRTCKDEIDRSFEIPRGEGTSGYGTGRRERRVSFTKNEGTDWCLLRS